MNFPTNWPKALIEMEADRDGWRSSHDRLFQENKRLRAIIADVITKYDDSDSWNRSELAAELINVTLREAVKEVGR